jgi:hypothetical protein
MRISIKILIIMIFVLIPEITFAQVKKYFDLPVNRNHNAVSILCVPNYSNAGSRLERIIYMEQKISGFPKPIIITNIRKYKLDKIKQFLEQGYADPVCEYFKLCNVFDSTEIDEINFLVNMMKSDKDLKVVSTNYEIGLSELWVIYHVMHQVYQQTIFLKYEKELKILNDYLEGEKKKTVLQTTRKTLRNIYKKIMYKPISHFQVEYDALVSYSDKHRYNLSNSKKHFKKDMYEITRLIHSILLLNQRSQIIIMESAEHLIYAQDTIKNPKRFKSILDYLKYEDMAFENILFITKSNDTIAANHNCLEGLLDENMGTNNIYELAALEDQFNLNSPYCIRALGYYMIRNWSSIFQKIIYVENNVDDRIYFFPLDCDD